MKRIFDHIDLRVPSLGLAAQFYHRFLPMVGFTQNAQIEGWIQYLSEQDDEVSEFFGVTEDLEHVPNRNRIAFWAKSKDEVDRLALEIRKIGAQNLEGPAYEVPGYYAVFFEDPFGNRFEICHRTEN